MSTNSIFSGLILLFTFFLKALFCKLFPPIDKLHTENHTILQILNSECVRNLTLNFFFFFCGEYLIFYIFNAHAGRWEKILKKFTMVYIQKGLTLEYTAQPLNLFNSWKVNYMKMYQKRRSIISILYSIWQDLSPWECHMVHSYLFYNLA